MQRTWKLFTIEWFGLLIANVSGGLILTNVIEPIVRIPVGLFYTIFLPGYLILRLIYFYSDEDKHLWIIGLIVPTGIALSSCVLLALNYFWEYSIGNSILIIGSFNIFAGANLILLKLKHPATRSPFNLILKAHEYVASQQKARKSYQSLVFLAFPLLFFISSVLFAITTEEQTMPMTEFYVLSPNRTITDQIIQDNQFKLGVVNREGKDVEYNIVVSAKSPLKSEELWSETIFIRNGAYIEADITIPNISSEVQEINLSLYKKGESRLYRSLVIARKNFD